MAAPFRLPILDSIVLLKKLLHGPNTKIRFQESLDFCTRIHCRGNMIAEPLPRNGSACYNVNIHRSKNLKSDRGM